MEYALGKLKYEKNRRYIEMLKPGLILFCIALIMGAIGFFIGGGSLMVAGYLTPFLIYIANHVGDKGE